MSKNGAIIILNDFKKRRDKIEKKYINQKNKKITKKHIFIYTLGFICAFGASCFVFPTSIVISSCILAGYGLGLPFTYSFIQHSKEENLKNELNKYNKNIKKLMFELEGIQVNHQYIDERKGLVVDDFQLINTCINSNDFEDDNLFQEECGPKLSLKK